MRRLLFVIALLCASSFATTFTSTQSGNLSVGATWVGGTAPSCAGGDIVVIAAGHTVTQDVNCTLGSSAAGVGDAIDIKGTATFVPANGFTLTLRGFDTTTNRLLNVEQNGNWSPQAGANIVLDVAADYGSIMQVSGNWNNTGGATYGIPSANITWSNASGSVAISAASTQPYDANNNIALIKLNTSGGVNDPGQVSNSGGTGLGSFGNSSFTVVSGGFDGGTTHNEVASYANIASNGDYYIDYNLGVLWYKSAANLTVTYSFKFETHFSFGIWANANTTQSAILFDSNTVNYCGSNVSATQSESAGMCLNIDNKYAPGVNAGRAAEVKNNVFNNCVRPIQLYSTSVSSNSNASNLFQVTGNAFNYARYNGNNNNANLWANGLINYGYTNYLNFSSNTFNSAVPIFDTVVRTPPSLGNTVSNNTGSILTERVLLAMSNSTFSGNTLTGFGGIDDYSVMEAGGDAVNGVNTYSNNTIGYCHRVGRLSSYMTITGNSFYRCYHHGIVSGINDGYTSNVTITNNVIYDSLPSSSFSGGATPSYNHKQWNDGWIVSHNTFDDGVRTLEFNDLEGVTSLITRYQGINNIASNSTDGIFKTANGGGSTVSMQAYKLDYNDDYNNTTNPTNIAQATFMRSGAEYNTGTRNIAGVGIFGPSGYTLPDATSRSLVLTASGTAGTNYAATIAWSGGTAVSFLQDQGTSTGTNSSTTLNDTGKAWTVNAFITYQVWIASGTGSGQFGMVISNTATQLTVVANTANSAWGTVPDATSKYVIFKSQIAVLDSGAVNSVQAGIHTPTLTTAAGTYTDSGITMAKNSFNVNPNYVGPTTGVSVNFHPKAASLKAAGSDGADLGALSVSSGVKHRITTQ